MPTRQAPAKLNLTLHITGKRADGYHLLESVVAFTALHDQLHAEAADTLSLQVEGPFATLSGDPEHNLVLRAARLLQQVTGTMQGAALRLQKNIPAGAGLGGGSSDAAATLRLLNDLWKLQLDEATLAKLGLQLGADVPMFLHGQPVLASGIGEVLAPLSEALPPLHAVLVYPGAPLDTVSVYRAYRHAECAHAADWRAGRNDLQHAAITLMPRIAEILLALETVLPSPILARMTGSGACCFALYETAEEATRAAAQLKADYPEWWVEPTALLT